MGFLANSQTSILLENLKKFTEKYLCEALPSVGASLSQTLPLFFQALPNIYLNYLVSLP